MIAEAATLDAGTVGVGAAAVLIVVAAGWAATFTSLRADVRSLSKEVRRALHGLAEAENDAADHRHRDNSIHQQLDLRVHLIERELQMVTPRPVTPEEYHGVERRRTPKPLTDTPKPDDST